jgi:hypothetical protein
MNGDLRFRLLPFHKMNRIEQDFMALLIVELSEEAQYNLKVAKDTKVTIHFVEVENGEDDSAFMLGDGVDFEVFIDPRMPVGMCIDFLIHELAHVHSWEAANNEEDHCDEFGKSYALLYRRYLEIYEDFWIG